MNAMLLCAGLGTRFRPATEKLAKPAIPFLNIPLLGYSLFDLEKINPKNVVINTHHLPDTVRGAAEALARGQSYSLHFSHEPTILGSGGGIRAAEKHLRAGSNDEFVVANGDEVIIFSHDKGFAPLIEFHRQSGALATLLTTVHPEAGRTLGGVWADSDGRITRLGEKYGEKNAPQAALKEGPAQHFAGVFVFSQRIFKFMPGASVENPAGKAFHIFTDCLLPAIAAGEKVLAFQDSELLWLDTTDAKSFIASTGRALSEMAGGAAGAHLLAIQNRYGHKFAANGQGLSSSGVWLAEGAKFNGSLAKGAYLFMGEKSEIASGVEVNGFAVVGAGARFSQGVIESSVIAPGVHINEMVAIRRQVIVG